MKMSETLESAFNNQISVEFHSAYTYLQMAAYFEDRHLPGFAHWLRLQSDEEWGHALRFYAFVLERGNRVRLGPISAPKHGFESALQVFEEALTQERSVTKEIQALYGLAMDERDYESFSVLQAFINEQVEEENSVELIVAQLHMAGDDSSAILILDRELGSRGAAAG